METILLVEDKFELREMLTKALQRMQYAILAVGSAEEGMTALRKQHFSAVLTDLKLPEASGMDVLRTAVDVDPALPVVIMTAYGSIAEAVAAMREGAYDFIQKPIDLDHLKHLLARAMERHQLMRENLVLKEEYARIFGFPRIVGEHPVMQTSAREMQKIAPTDTTVLLLGESGTGKELFARAIHQLSPRASKPFIALNCAAIPESLIENELFGHEKGAFTGADTRRAGKFELAHGGTIFLDEIGELPLAVQSKLLRVLEERTVQRLGATSEIKVDVRVVTATNRDLERATKSGAFRQDLYYRLAVVPIMIPPLRERGDDVLLLAEYFLDRFRRELRKPRLSLTEAARCAMRQYEWPGNVRELQNAMERAAILQDEQLTPRHLGLEAAMPPSAQPAEDFEERTRIEAALRESKWNRQAAAERLGMSYKTLLARIKTYGLD
jgi:DNA-binding NtrC family response regulator